MTTSKTAAGQIIVLDSAFSPSRGNTRVFLGTLSDGRYVVTSRFQIEVRTKSETKARAVYQELCRG